MNAVDRISRYFDIPSELSASVTSSPPPAAWPSTSTTPLVVVERVAVKASAEQGVADGVSLTFDPGERVALVGRFGSGKSALAMSLLKFAEPNAGRILVDGINITNIDTQILRRRIVSPPPYRLRLITLIGILLDAHIPGCCE